MQPMFEALLKLMTEPSRLDRGIKTDNSILLIYPPEKELDFREQLLDTFVPALQAQGAPFELLNLTGFMFAGLTEEDVEALHQDELDDYRCTRVCPNSAAGAQARTSWCTAPLRSIRSCVWETSCVVCAIFTVGSPWRSPATSAAGGCTS